MGDLQCTMDYSCSKLATFDWMEEFRDVQCDNLFEVRFKNTHKGFFKNDSDIFLKIGDIVAVEATTGQVAGPGKMAGSHCQRAPGDDPFPADSGQ